MCTLLDCEDTVSIAVSRPIGGVLMDLTVRPATGTEVEFAWTLYPPYVVEYIYPKLKTNNIKGIGYPRKQKNFVRTGAM